MNGGTGEHTLTVTAMRSCSDAVDEWEAAACRRSKALLTAPSASALRCGRSRRTPSEVPRAPKVPDAPSLSAEEESCATLKGISAE